MGSLNADILRRSADFLDSTDYESSQENVSILGSRRPSSLAQEGKTGFPGAVFIIVNACIGVGMLNFPAAYVATGAPFIGIVIQLIVVIFIICSLLLLALCADINRSSTYQDVVSSMIGRFGLRSCEVCIIFYCLGACIAYLIVVGDQMDDIWRFVAERMPNMKLHQYFFTSRYFSLAFLGTCILFPLCIPKKVEFLKYPSSVGVFASLYVCIVIVSNYFVMKGEHRLHPGTDAKYSWTHVFFAIPTICFGFQCHLTAIPVYASLKNRNVRHFGGIIVVATTISSVSYILAGLFGALTFGSDVCADVLQTYSADNVTIIIARSMILINMLTTYPLLHYCGRLAIETMYKSLTGLSNYDRDVNANFRRYVETTVWFFLSLLLAMFLPNIQVVISPIGGLAAIFIFVFPGLCLLQFIFQHSATSERKKQYLIAVSVVFVAIGTFIFGSSVTISIMTDENKVPNFARCIRTSD